MIEIIFVAHGLSATAMEDSVAMVLGQHHNFHTIALTQDEGIDHFRQQLCSLVKHLQQNGNCSILILADMPAGTPYNVSVQLSLTEKNIEVLSGTNFPMILTALNHADLPLSQLTTLVIETGRESINRFISVDVIQEDF